jgi:putative transposase
LECWTPRPFLISAHFDPEYIAEIRAATNGNYVLGNNRFKEEINRMLKRRVMPGKAGRRARGEDEGEVIVVCPFAVTTV